MISMLLHHIMKNIPPITRIIITTIVLISFIVGLEYYRLITCLFFMGKFGMLTIIKIYMIFRYSSRLEDDTFRSKSADYFKFICFVIITMLVASYFLNLPFASQCFSSTLVYVWAKKNPRISINLFGLLNFRAPYLPYCFLLVNIVLKSTLIYEVFGILIGHCYYFAYFIIPKLPMTREINIFSSSVIFTKLTDFLGLDSKRELLLEEADFIDDDEFEQRLNNQVLI